MLCPADELDATSSKVPTPMGSTSRFIDLNGYIGKDQGRAIVDPHTSQKAGERPLSTIAFSTLSVSIISWFDSYMEINKWNKKLCDLRYEKSHFYIIIIGIESQQHVMSHVISYVVSTWGRNKKLPFGYVSCFCMNSFIMRMEQHGSQFWPKVLQDKRRPESWIKRATNPMLLMVCAKAIKTPIQSPSNHASHWCKCANSFLWRCG